MNLDHTSPEFEGFSYLEFGYTAPLKGVKKTYELKIESKAYDWFMHARYSNDLFAYLQMSEALKQQDIKEAARIFQSEVHHPNDLMLNLSKLISLSLFKKPSFFEFGQTLFGCIEGIEFANSLLRSSKINFEPPSVDTITWHGFDISEFFNTLAKVMHGGRSIQTTNNLEDIANTMSVFFAKGVTLLYAVQTPQDLISLLSKADMAIFDYSLSTSGDRKVQLGTGKDIHFLDHETFAQAFDEHGSKLYVRESAQKLESESKLSVECLFGDEARCIEFQNREKDAVEKIQEKYPNESEILLSKLPSNHFQWTTLDKYL